MQVDLGTEVARHTGNAYTASLWGGLASLVNGTGQQLEDCQVIARNLSVILVSSYMNATCSFQAIKNEQLHSEEIFTPLSNPPLVPDD